MKRLLFFSFIILSGFSQAQTAKNVLLEKYTNQQHLIKRPAVAISLKDHDNIVVSGANGQVFYSVDGGDSWQKSKIKFEMDGKVGHPLLISDKKGDFYYLYSVSSNNDGKEVSNIFCAVSDEGSLWSEKYSVTQGETSAHSPQGVIDLKSNELYVTWSENIITNEICESNILLSSTKNGKKWSDPIRLNSQKGNCSNNPLNGAIPATGFAGEIFVIWLNGQHIIMDRSFDKGKNWLSMDVALPGIDKVISDPVLLSDNSVSQYKGVLYLNWSNQGLWFSRSFKYGDHWQSPVKINNGLASDRGLYSWMSIDNKTGYLYIVYYDVNEAQEADVYLTYTYDGGATFHKMKISETPFKPTSGFQAYPNLAAHDGKVMVTWQRIDDNRVSLMGAVINQDQLPNLPEAKKKK
ncbi:MAG: sialidase family protein [Fulvivirga sp.]|nr:sialidase family protein [Fulvivirga sp.]